jgi:hypothetical protein
MVFAAVRLVAQRERVLTAFEGNMILARRLGYFSPP